MKMLGKYLESITGVEIFPIISFLIFFLFFILVTLYVIRLDKNFIREVSNYPVSGNQEDNDDHNFPKNE